MKRNNLWTPEEDAELWRLAEKGYSAAQIAAELRTGKTRNAIIGRMKRAGIKSKNARYTDENVQKRIKAKREKMVNVKKPSGPTAEPVDLETAFTSPIDDRPPILFSELGDSSCRWPIGNLYCGGPALSGKPYCARHAATGRRDKPMRQAPIKYGWRR